MNIKSNNLQLATSAITLTITILVLIYFPYAISFVYYHWLAFSDAELGQNIALLNFIYDSNVNQISFINLSNLLINAICMALVIGAIIIDGRTIRQLVPLAWPGFRQLLFWCALFALLGWFGGLLIDWVNVDVYSKLDDVVSHQYLPYFLSAVLVAPIVEEVFLRGYLFSVWRQSRLGLWGTILVTSLLFALLHAHMYPPLALLLIFLDGILLGWVRERTGSLVVPIAMHILNNLLASVFVIYFV